MTETRPEYKVLEDIEINKRAILASPYFQCVADTANTLLLGEILYESDDELIDRAIAFTDKLILKVGEKL